VLFALELLPEYASGYLTSAAALVLCMPVIHRFWLAKVLLLLLKLVMPRPLVMGEVRVELRLVAVLSRRDESGEVVSGES
jgi:hypothetical protein